jgi:heat shock protein HtpX
MPRTFRDLIAENRRKSTLLVMGFMAFFTITIYVFTLYATGADARAGLVPALIGLGIGAALAFFSYEAGAGAILAMSGAKPIKKEDDPQLYNVVEELSIAAGLPLPRIYLIDDTAMNAFATGRGPKNAVVAITKGLRDRLTREELQGVLAHEMSHVRNYDIRFAMLLAVMVGLLALLADGMRRWMWWGGARRRSSRDGGAGAFMAIIALFAIIFSIVAPILGKLIQLAASREREYLADASSVELTRNPEGLASALEKLGKDQEVLEVANRATQHLYIVNPFKPFETRAAGLLSTHPPLEERIRRLRALEGAARSSNPAVS